VIKTDKEIAIIMIRGLPGSGKSTIAKALVNHLGPESAIVLDPDLIDFDNKDYKSLESGLREEGVDEKLYPYRYLRMLAHRAISAGKIVIWNQAFTHQELLHKTIVNLESYAAERSIATRSLVVEVNIDEQTAKTRVTDRVNQGKHSVSEKEFMRFLSDYKPFSGYNHHVISVDGTLEPYESVKIILNTLGF
jgi:predicted kinase